MQEPQLTECWKHRAKAPPCLKVKSDGGSGTWFDLISSSLELHQTLTVTKSKGSPGPLGHSNSLSDSSSGEGQSRCHAGKPLCFPSVTASGAKVPELQDVRAPRGAGSLRAHSNT